MGYVSAVKDYCEGLSCVFLLFSPQTLIDHQFSILCPQNEDVLQYGGHEQLPVQVRIEE